LSSKPPPRPPRPERADGPAPARLDLEPAALPSDAIEVARVLGPWGVKGWIRLAPHSASPEALFSSRRWYLAPPERGASALSGVSLLPIAEAREHGDGVVARSPAIAGRDEAGSLRGARVFVPRSSFPTAAEGEYYWVDLIGLAVVNAQGVDLGRVRELMSNGPQSVLVVEADEGEAKPRERLIPFVDAYVTDVDLAGRRITVDWQPDY